MAPSLLIALSNTYFNTHPPSDILTDLAPHSEIDSFFYLYSKTPIPPLPYSPPRPSGLAYHPLAQRPGSIHSKKRYQSMALAHYSPFLDRPLPIQSKHPYLLSVAQKQVLPMSNPYSWNKSTSGLESWDAPQTSWTIDSSYSTLQSAIPPSEPTTSQAASRAHPLQQHPLPRATM
jgi:hypothetical protein